MDWSLVGQIAVGAIAAGAALIEVIDGRLAGSRRRRQVLTDLDIPRSASR